MGENNANHTCDKGSISKYICIKNSFNSTAKKYFFFNVNNFPKKKYRQSTGTGKGAQHYESSRCNHNEIPSPICQGVCVCVCICVCPCVCVSPSVVKLCEPVDYSLPCTSVHGILQARIPEWIAILFPRDLPNPGIKSGYPALQSDFLPTKPPGKLPVRKLFVRKALIKKTANNNCWLACEKKKGIFVCVMLVGM